MELKKPQPSILVGGMQMQKRLVPHPRVVSKNSGGISWDNSDPGFHARKKSPHNFWLQKPAGIESVEENV